MDLLHLPESPFAKINIHVGGAYGNKSLALSRFAENYLKLPASVRKRLTVENDDKMNMFSVADLLWLHNETGIPVVFDYFHHEFCTGGLDEEEAFLAAVDTWPDDIKPIVHFSSSKKKFEDASAVATAHADYVYSEVRNYNKDVDVMLEAKAKDAAVMKYLEDFNAGSSSQ
jgi:UV DNA damage endonuclease